MGVKTFPQKLKCGKLVDNFCGKLEMWKKSEKARLSTNTMF
jgi:hypothetical protein